MISNITKPPKLQSDFFYKNKNAKLISMFSHQSYRQFEKKAKNLCAQRKINRSAFINKLRLKKTEIMYGMCLEIFQQVLLILYRKSHFIKIINNQNSLSSDENTESADNSDIKKNQIAKSLFSQCDSHITKGLQQNFLQFFSQQAEYKYTLIKFILQGTIRMFQTKLKIYTLEKDLPILKEIIKDCQYCYNNFMQESMGKFGNQFNICYQIVGQKDFLRQRKIDSEYLYQDRNNFSQQKIQNNFNIRNKSLVNHQNSHNSNSNTKQSTTKKSLNSSNINMNSPASKKKQNQQVIGVRSSLQQQTIKRKELLKSNDGHSCIGGIILTDETGNISYNNTFDSRLNILMESCLPLVRQIIWGNSKDQKQHQVQSLK